MSLRRRDFLKAGGVAAGVALLEGCRRREQLIFDQAVGRAAAPAGVATWPKGVCGQCPAGCGTLVKVLDDEAKKIEGNPDHPVNLGGLCALGQSALQEHYNPDRITTPLRRRSGGGTATGADGFEAIEWEEALAEAARWLSSARERGAGGLRLVAGGDSLVTALWRRFAAALEQPEPVLSRPHDEQVERVAAREVFGYDRLPYYDLAEADFVLGLGAAFVDRWRSPVHYARALVEMRQRRRSRLVQAEARMSLTAAAADRWLPLRPGSEGVLARALAGRLLASGRVAAAASERYRRLFPAPAPALEEAAAACDLPVAKLERLAADLARAERPLVIAGGSAALHRHGVDNVAAGMALNLLLGAVGRRGGVHAGASFGLAETLLPAPRPGDASQASDDSGARPGTGLLELVDRLSDAELLIVSECDPAHHLPPSSPLRARGDGGPRVLALSSFFDDTTLDADLILPIQSDLERRQAIEPSPGTDRPAVGLSAPVLEPLGDSRHPGDIVLALAATQDSLSVEMPWESMEDVATQAIDSARQRLPGDERATATRLLRSALGEGGIWSEGPPVEGEERAAELAEAAGGPLAEPPAPADDVPTLLTLIPFESVKSGDGRGANRPWLQELPDPLSTVMWRSWVEISLADAESLGLATGDLARLASPAGEVVAAVFVSPAARPGTAALPLGQGHRDFGRYARERGANPLDLAGDEVVSGAGVPALGEVRVSVTRVASKERAAIYGRGLRQAENVPVGWRPPKPPPLRQARAQTRPSRSSSPPSTRDWERA